jgi:hypothetical protein
LRPKLHSIPPLSLATPATWRPRWLTTFLNRLLALTIDLQNTLVEVFDGLLRTRIEGAMASGTYVVGVESVTADSLKVTGRCPLYVHPASGVEGAQPARFYVLTRSSTWRRRS